MVGEKCDPSGLFIFFCYFLKSHFWLCLVVDIVRVFIFIIVIPWEAEAAVPWYSVYQRSVVTVAI